MKHIYKYIFKTIKSGKIDKKIFFLHLPKCGGMSIKNAIICLYGLKETLTSQKNDYLNAASSKIAGDKLNLDQNKLREYIQYYYMCDPDMMFVSGHYPFSLKAFNEFGNDWNYITILREPVSRWISAFFARKYTKNQISHVKINDSLEEFIDSYEAVRLGNSYIRQMLVLDERVKEYSSKDSILKTIDILKRFKLVGILENLDQFLNEFELIFGARPILSRDNTSPVTKKFKDMQINEQILEKVRELCKPNVEVYNYFAKRNE